MTEKIEVFYTGGGITLAEADINVNQYAVVSSEAPEFLSVYKYADGEKTYLPEDMISSTHMDAMPAELKDIYIEMRNKLRAA